MQSRGFHFAIDTKDISFLFNPQQFVNIDFENFRNLDKCLHRWLAGIGTPFTYGSWCTFQLLG